MLETSGSQTQAQKPASAAVQAKFRQAMALHSQGQLAGAERIYRDVLRQQPQHFDALHMLGVIALQTGHAEQAANLIRNAIALNADVAAAHYNLGKTLTTLGASEEALASYQRAIALKPDYARPTATVRAHWRR